MKSKNLTKKDLIEKYQITEVTPDGEVYVNHRLAKPVYLTTKHKYGQNKTYLAVTVYDPDKYVYAKHTDGKYYRQKAQSNLMVHRVVFAWFNGECKAQMTIDHLNGNSFDNRIDNLEEVTLATNVKRKKRTSNQKSCRYNYAFIKAYRAFRAEANVKANEAKERKVELQKQLKDLKSLWHTQLNNLDVYGAQDTKDRIKITEQDIKDLREEWNIQNKNKTVSLDDFNKIYKGGE